MDRSRNKLAFVLRVAAVVSATVLAVGYVIFAQVNAPHLLVAAPKQPIESGEIALGSVKITANPEPSAPALDSYVMTSSKSGPPPLRDVAPIISAFHDHGVLFSWPSMSLRATGETRPAPSTPSIIPETLQPTNLAPAEIVLPPLVTGAGASLLQPAAPVTVPPPPVFVAPSSKSGLIFGPSVTIPVPANPRPPSHP